MSTVFVCAAPEDLPGERTTHLTTPEWSTLGWAARPSDTHGASLIYDGLAATGVDWRVNLASKLDIVSDRAHLQARLRTADCQCLAIGNSHYLTPSVRKVALTLAGSIGADLYFIYEDGSGTNIKQSGVLDEAERRGWTVLSAQEFPFDTPRPAPLPCTDTANDSSTSKHTFGEAPLTVPTVDFTMFRAWCRSLLTPQDFTTIDRWYREAYDHASRLDIHDREAISALAVEQLHDRRRAEAITRLRGMQAALFRNGAVWNLRLTALDGWRSGGERPTPTDHDYARLVQLRDARTAAVAVLASLDITPQQMTTLSWEDMSAQPGTCTEGLTAAALRPLSILRELTNGDMLRTTSPHRNAISIKFLAYQFGFPLKVDRAKNGRATSVLDPDALDLRPYSQQ